MKKKLLAVAMVLCCLAIVTGGSLAYFTAEKKAHNVITTGSIDIELQELTDQVDGEGNPVPFENLEGVMPGSSASKIVQVKNTGSQPAWIRVSVEKAVQLAESAEGEGDPSLITMDFNAEKWTEKDGYYYYSNVLAPGDTTQPLFTAVTFASSMDNLYQGSEISVDVCAYATQSANNGETVFEAQGWPAPNRN